jgi:aromatic-L-amino-acid decarboxylase
MNLKQFRADGAAALAWVSRYLEQIEKLPVLSQAKPGDVRRRLPAAAPEDGEPFEAVLRDLDDVIVPGITHWQSPNFYAFFPGNHSPPGILGDLVSSGIGVQGMLWISSPACTELEAHMLDWLVGLLDLPARFLSTGKGGGVIQDTASSAILCAMLAARERATGYKTNELGLAGGPVLTAYTSSQAHSSLEKAAGIAGIGRRHLRLVDVDEAFAMRPDKLQREIAEDRAAGHTPFFVCASVGTTASTAIDPVPAIAEICKREKLWLHVDAAHAGSAAVCPELRWIQQGLEHADSYSFNPHKWLLTNFDCDCFYVADRSALIGTLSVLPEYLRNQPTATGDVIDYRDWHIPLGRRFRALKLWFVMRHYGATGLRAHVRKHVALARELTEWIGDDQRFVLAAPAPLNLVCFRHRSGDDATQRLLDAINASGKAYCTHARLAERLVIRVAIGGTWTERRHVEGLWKLIKKLAS